MISGSGSGSELLTGKQVTLFARSKAAFDDWAEEHSPAEVEQAIIEINSAVAKDEAAIDATIEMNRNQYIARQALVKRGDEVYLQFLRRHPELTTSAQTCQLIVERFNLILRSKGIPDQPGEVYDHVTVENFETAYRQLAEEGRITWNQAVGSPWGHREYKHSEPSAPEAEPLTQEEIEAKLDSGELSLEEVREMADQQLAAQNPNAPVNSDPVSVPEPSSDAPVERVGIMALAYKNKIHLKQ